MWQNFSRLAFLRLKCEVGLEFFVKFQLILLEDAAIWFGLRHASFLPDLLGEGELLSNT